MSTAAYVPESAELDGEDVLETLDEENQGSILRDAFIRFRHADGFSYARSVAFQLVLTLIPGVIFVVALAARMGEGWLQNLLRAMIESVAPGPAGEFFLSAFAQGSSTGSGSAVAAIVAGGAAALISAVTAMAQVQRGASRIYGVDSDRPTLQRYATALRLTLTAGLLLTVVFIGIGLGQGFPQYIEDQIGTAWRWFRWPVGFLIVGVAFAALFRAVPNRRQPKLSWLGAGGTVSAIGWFAVSVALSLYLHLSSTFGETYGPLAGVIGFMLWSQLSAIAILFGIAYAAQVEAVRAGVPGPTEESADV